MAEASYPDDLRYHDRARLGADRGRRGDASGSPGTPRTRSARSSSSTRPRSARAIQKDSSYAEVESVKAVSDVIAPMSGEIVEVNDALAATRPEKINEDPYGEGWLVKVQADLARGGRGAARRRRNTASCWTASANSPAPRSRSLSRVTRYTSATPDDRAEMLAAIGVDSVAELFEQIPEPLRLGRPLALPDGLSEAEVYERLAGAGRAQRRRRSAGLLRRRRDVRPLRAGDRRRDHLALGVPHALHALPAGDLPGRAAGDVRVPDGDVGADRAAGLQRRPLRGPLLGRLGRLPGDGRDQAQPLRRLPRRPPAQPRDARHLLGRLRRRGGRGRARGRADRRRGAGRGGRRRDRRGLPAEPQLPRRGRGRRGARRGGEGARRAAGRRLRPDDAGRSSSRRASAAPTSPSARASRSATASTSAAPRSASSARPRSRSAACRAGSPAKPRTSTAAAASSSRCRPASSTSAARKRPTTSAPRRR